MTADDNLWISILSEVRHNATSKLPSNKSLLVLGDNSSGKTTLIAKLQGVEQPQKGSGLEYAYIDVRDEYRDDHTRLGVWILDGDPSLSFLMKFALSEETYVNTTIVFVTSMATPWNILDQLHQWATILQDHIDKLKISSHNLDEYRNKCIKRWSEYVEHGMDDIESPMPKRTSRNLEDDNDAAALGTLLGEKTLTRNLGLDVIVVITKTDYVCSLEKDYGYKDEHFDFIQQWIRKFCLQYGAALFYTSAKEDKNCDLLYKYLTHRVYGLPFQAPALIVEKDAVFIPSGWDSTKKISILQENLINIHMDDYYSNVIAPPVITRKTVVREVEVQAEDEQAFLTRQFELLLQNSNVAAAGAAGGGGGKQEAGSQQPRLSASPSMQKGADRRLSGSPSMQSPLSATKKIDPKTNAANPGEGVLANFFNSLLHKKIGASPRNANDLSSLSPSSANSSLRTDAAAELDKLASRKSSLTNVVVAASNGSGSGSGNNSLLFTTPNKDGAAAATGSPTEGNSFSEC